MKLTEIENERTFSLEISETDLRDLFSVVAFWPAKMFNEEYTDKAFDIIASFTAMVSEVGVSSGCRSYYVKSEGV